MTDTERQTGGEVLERTRQETKKPELFKVLLLNDDYTTMEFVVEILRIFEIILRIVRRTGDVSRSSLS